MGISKQVVNNWCAIALALFCMTVLTDVSFGQEKKYEMTCKINETSILSLSLSGVITQFNPTEYYLAGYHVRNIVHRIGTKAYYVDLFDADNTFDNSFFSTIATMNWGRGLTVTHTFIPRFKNRPWNDLDAENTYPYYEKLLAPGENLPTAEEMIRDGVQKEVANGSPEFLQIASPMLYTYPEVDRSGHSITAAGGKTLIVHLQQSQQFMKGMGFLVDEQYLSKDQVVGDLGELLLSPQGSLFPCELTEVPARL